MALPLTLYGYKQSLKYVQIYVVIMATECFKSESYLHHRVRKHETVTYTTIFTILISQLCSSRTLKYLVNSSSQSFNYEDNGRGSRLAISCKVDKKPSIAIHGETLTM